VKKTPYSCCKITIGQTVFYGRLRLADEVRSFCENNGLPKPQIEEEKYSGQRLTRFDDNHKHLIYEDEIKKRVRIPEVEKARERGDRANRREIERAQNRDRNHARSRSPDIDL